MRFYILDPIAALSDRREEQAQTPVGGKTAEQCDDCKTEAGVDKFCKTCQKSLCEYCAKRHSRARDNHEIIIVSKTDTESDFPINLIPCPVHPLRNAVEFCNKCSVPICVTCNDEMHMNHSTVAIDMKYIESTEKLKYLARDMEQNTLPILVSNMEHLRQELKLHEQGLQDVENEVNKFRKQLKTAVDEGCDSLIDELRQTQADQISDINDVLSDLERQVQEIEQLISMYGGEVRGGGLDLIEYSIAAQHISDSLPSIISYGIPMFVPSQDILNALTNHVLCDIKWDPKVINLTKLKIPSKADLKCEKPLLDIELSDSFCTDISSTSVVPASKDTLWIAGRHSETMHMYDTKGEKIRSITMREQAKILDLAVKQSGDVIVCTSDNKVSLVTVDGAVNTLIDTEPYCPKGVCLTKRTEIAVCMTSRDGNYLAVFSSDGRKKVRKIIVNDHHGKQILVDPRRVVMNGEYFSVMNFLSNVVTCDEVGKVTWVYDGSKTKFGELFATGICGDKFCNLFISDYRNDCLHYVDREGGLIQILLTRGQPGIKRPIGIGVDDDAVEGKVWVGTNRHELLVLKYKTH